jgi:amino acid transporter
MSEETHNASMSGPLGIIMAIGVSALLGWFLLLGLLFSIQDYDLTIASSTGQPVTQIFLDTVGEKGAIVLMVIVIVAMFFCGTFSITSNSRMMYAFARDGGIPGHKFFHKVDVKRKSPIRTVWLACTLSFILGLPSLGSAVAFSAATSIATIGLYISYGMYNLKPMCHLLVLKTHFRYSCCPPSDLPRRLQAGSFLPWPVLISGRNQHCCVDRIHLHRLLPPGVKPCYFRNTQLCACRRWYCYHV